MAVDRADLIAELTKLRQGYGLTPQALTDCPNVLEALGNRPLQQAFRQLVQLLHGLGDHEQAKVVRIAFAVDGHVPGVLSARRSAYHEETGRDIKTLIRYENRMIEELATQLLTETPPQKLFVTAVVESQRIDIYGVKHDKLTPATPPELEREYKNQTNHQSLPFFVYRLPTRLYSTSSSHGCQVSRC